MKVTVRGDDRERELNDVMEFDHVIRVHPDGTVSTPGNVWAPEMCEGVLSQISQMPGGLWSLMAGYSQQDSYHGPIMHPSEYIGGTMAEDIMSHPGLYVALIEHMCDEYCDDDTCHPDGDGWVVAYIHDPESEDKT